VASISWWSRSRLALHDLVKAARQFEPELWRNFQRELSPSRHWADRAVVLTYAIVTGLVVVAFTLLAEAATHAFASMSRMHPLAPYAALAWTPLLTVAMRVVHAPVRAGRRGIGNPAGDALALDDRTCRGRASSAWLVSLRLALSQGGTGVSGGLLAGLSIGPGGPDRPGRSRRDGPTPGSWLSPQLGHRRPRSDGGRRGSRHCRRVQHAAGRHRLRAGAAHSAAPPLAQLAGDRLPSCWRAWWRSPCSATRPTSAS
jgi:hypothetical protein